MHVSNGLGVLDSEPLLLELFVNENGVSADMLMDRLVHGTTTVRGVVAEVFATSGHACESVIWSKYFLKLRSGEAHSGVARCVVDVGVHGEQGPFSFGGGAAAAGASTYAEYSCSSAVFRSTVGAAMETRRDMGAEGDSELLCRGSRRMESVGELGDEYEGDVGEEAWEYDRVGIPEYRGSLGDTGDDDSLIFCDGGGELICGRRDLGLGGDIGMGQVE